MPLEMYLLTSDLTPGMQTQGSVSFTSCYTTFLLTLSWPPWTFLFLEHPTPGSLHLLVPLPGILTLEI